MSNLYKNKFYILLMIIVFISIFSFRLFIFPVLENKIKSEENLFKSSEIRKNFVEYRYYLSGVLNELGYSVGYSKYTNEMVNIEKKVIYLDKMINIKIINKNENQNIQLNNEYIKLKKEGLIKK